MNPQGVNDMTTTTATWLTDSNTPAAKNLRTAIVLFGTITVTALAWAATYFLSTP
jgi:hypothetical protein